MLAQETKMINFSAASVIDNGDGTGEVMAYFNGTIGKDGLPSIQQQIRNIDLYKQHSEEVKNDFTEFQSKVIENIG